MFKLEAKPIFSAEVDIPVPGAAPEKVKFDFRHKTRAEFDALTEGIRKDEKTIETAVHEVVAGWTAPGVEFSSEALDSCFQIFPGSPFAIWMAYRSNLIEGRRKN